jgi:hypothetical protein
MHSGIAVSMHHAALGKPINPPTAISAVMQCKVEKKLPKGQSFDENQCECLECYQKRKYNRNRKIYGHNPPVKYKRAFQWYQASCDDGSGPKTVFYAYCQYGKAFARSSDNSTVATTSQPYLVDPQDRKCEQGMQCHNVKCALCKNRSSDISKGLEDAYEALKGGI